MDADGASSGLRLKRLVSGLEGVAAALEGVAAALEGVAEALEVVSGASEGFLVALRGVVRVFKGGLGTFTRLGVVSWSFGLASTVGRLRGVRREPVFFTGLASGGLDAEGDMADGLRAGWCDEFGVRRK